MSGPLDVLFAQVREALLAHSTKARGQKPLESPALAALSSIERHVQDMDRIVLSASLVGVVCPECGTDDDTYWRGGMTASWECPCKGVVFTPGLAALSASGTPEGVAREKEEE